jgi:hypothetical protein
MKAIKIIIASLIVLVPFWLTILTLSIKVTIKNPFVAIWFILLAIYILIQFMYYADKFEKWFDSKLK